MHFHQAHLLQGVSDGVASELVAFKSSAWPRLVSRQWMLPSDSML